MNYFYVFLIITILQGCSFDNKSGIWNNENTLSKKEKENDVYKDFELVNTARNTFNQERSIDPNYKFKLSKPINNFKWLDNFYSKENVKKIFKYNNLNQHIFKSKKITKYETKNLLFDQNNVITSDIKGNIYIYSLKNKETTQKYNFYKKKYKKIPKKLNLIINQSIIYASDNFGYLYAYDYKKNKILWAKNHKIPFRSNLKIIEDKIITSNEENNLIFFNKFNGSILNSIPTEKTLLKNNFVNNISIGKEKSFFLNTYGSLYSIDNDTMRINWFINLNQSLDLNPSNLFNANIVINNPDLLITSSDQFTFIINAKTGSILNKKNLSTNINPMLVNNHLFLVTKNNLLILIDTINGQIIYSINIIKEIEKVLQKKKTNVTVKQIAILNDKIYLFLQNSNVLKFNIRGELEEINKLPTKLKLHPVFLEGSVLYLDIKNKINIVN